ncbi:MAG TPA: hypothetical protein VJR89_26690, partial [Polyangiales bacterium]|nr:hypothetical protein [Polyangiales bacterium]
EGGYPVLVYAHALGGVFNEAMSGEGLAVELARSSAHAAVLAIELPQHGARRGASERAAEDLLVNLLNPAAIRGNVLQGAADLWGAIALAQAGIPAELAPGAAAIRFDASRLALFGQGQGGAHAAIALAADDDVRSVVLANVAGHFATQLQRVKPAPFGALLPLLLADFDEDLRLPGSLTNPMLAHMQAVLDAADPINYAARLYRDSIPSGRDVFLVYGREDHYSPDPALEAYAKAARMQAVAPDLSMHFDDLPAPVQHNVSVGDERRTVALRQYDPSDDPVSPGEVRDGHFVVQSSKAARADVVRFLTQALSGQAPSIGL